MSAVAVEKRADNSVTGFLVLLPFRVIGWTLRACWRFPLHAFAALAVLFVLVALNNRELWWVAALLVAGSAAAFWKFWRRWKVARWRFKVSRVIASAMTDNLWKDLDARRFFSIEWRSDDVAAVQFSTPPGFDDEQVIKTFAKFRAALGLKETIHQPDDDAGDGRVLVLFCWASPLDEVLDGYDAPVLHMTEDERNNPYHWLTVGVSADGSPFRLPLFMTDLGAVRQMTAGASGSGKSSIINQQMAQAVLCPSIELMVLDGKGSEFGAFRPYVQKFGTTPKDFWAQLKYLEQERVRRAEILERNKMTGEDRLSTAWNPVDDGPFLLWVWDELGAIMGGFDGSQRMEAMGRLYGVLSVARSLGIGVIFSSQTFKSDILSTQVRDNCFDIAVGFKMNSTQEALYIGFESEDVVRPDLIRGKLLESGRSSTVGTFAMTGMGKPSFGKSYHLPGPAIASVLSSAPTIAEIEKQAAADLAEAEWANAESEALRLAKADAANPDNQL
ncbi:hypothetical protein [Citricoccus sp. I39-566]|uniref:hypothetical protein n=1 Tax=Citricoccus sp. I39-566 TaxID=3073268 RepID=UPI00286C1D7C|nr:hypothetical protein [Citricoccus sp. I39-566]WMY79204.1 hypothetical protein RE421_04895 [Citricoccus sp. I39-566]